MAGEARARRDPGRAFNLTTRPSCALVGRNPLVAAGPGITKARLNNDRAYAWVTRPHGLSCLGQVLQLLQPAAGPRTPIGVHSLAASAYEVMLGGKDLLVAAPFADDLVVTSVSDRGLQRGLRGETAPASLQKSCTHTGRRLRE